MKPQGLYKYLEDEVEYPVNHATVLDQFGSVTVDAPDEVDSETIAETLADDDDETYESADDLFESIFGNLDEDYIGRKYYDDRGANIDGPDGDYPRDERDESF